MKQLNATTKRGAGYLAAYRRSSASSLWDVYGRFSCAKAAAENDCRRWMENESGWGFKIISYNSCFFTAAWMTSAGLRVETAGGSYFVPLS